MLNEKIYKYRLLEMIGKGSFGKVYRAIDNSTKKLVAIKIIYLKNIAVGVLRQNINEIQMLSSVKSKYVLRFQEAFIEYTQSELWIVLEYMDSHTLSELIEKHQRQNQPIPENTIWRFLIELTIGLRTIHKYNIIHRDIKPSNVLLTDEELTAKICDFNVSEFVSESQNQSVIGTPSYIAPEVWKNSSYSCSCDVFALGCVVYELMTFKTAFYKDDVDELKDSIMNKPSPKFTHMYSAELKSLVLTCLIKDPMRRVSTSKILANATVISKAKEIGLSLFDKYVPNYSLTKVTLLPANSFPMDKGSKEFHCSIVNSVCQVDLSQKIYHKKQEDKQTGISKSVDRILLKGNRKMLGKIELPGEKNGVTSQKYIKGESYRSIKGDKVVKNDKLVKVDKMVKDDRAYSPFRPLLHTNSNKLSQTDVISNLQLKLLLKMQLVIIEPNETQVNRDLKPSSSISLGNEVISKFRAELERDANKSPRPSYPSRSPGFNKFLDNGLLDFRRRSVSPVGGACRMRCDKSMGYSPFKKALAKSDLLNKKDKLLPKQN